jgi:hypothetical protein
VTHSYDDDELLARLRAADPATSVPAADPASVARLLEDTMSNDVLTETRESGTHNRSPLTWLVAAAAALIIAAGGVFAVMNGSADPEPLPGAGPEPSASDPTVTELTAPGQDASPSRCMVPTAGPLSNADVAFDGTVTAMADGLVTLEPSRWYAGEPTDTVTVAAPNFDLRALLYAVTFKEGGRYLVAATKDGSLMVCGFSAPYDERLAATYEKAFGG